MARWRPLIFAASWLALTGIPAQAASLCAGTVPPEISVTVENGAVIFDTTYGMAELAALRIDTASPWPATYHTGLGGVMQGIIATQHRIHFTTATDNRTRQGCVRISRIEAILRLDPKIYIASELRTRECAFRNVFRHEAKHVAEDRALLERYKKVIARGLELAFSEPRDYAVGPIAAPGMGSARQYLEDGVAQTLAALTARMMRDRALLQQNVDSLGEYMAVSGGC